MPLQQSSPLLGLALSNNTPQLAIQLFEAGPIALAMAQFIPGSGAGGSVGGLPFRTSSEFPAITASLYGAPVDTGIAIQNAINTMRDAGGGILHMSDPNKLKGFYINSSVWARDRVIVIWDNDVFMGPRGRLGVGGSLDESGNGDSTYYLYADAAINDTVLHVGPTTNGTGNIIAELPVGTMLDIRGENDASGIAFERQRVTVTAQDLVNKTVTVTPPLEIAFQSVYPLSAYPNDKTTIKIVNQAILQTVAEGSIDVTVSDGTKFAINDVVCIEDTKRCADLVAGSSANQIHMETNIVRSIAGNVVTLQLPLAHSYDPAFAPRMVRTLPAKYAGHVNPRIRFVQQSDTNNQHCMLFLFAAFGICHGLRVMGEPNVNPALSLGSRGHGCRVSDGCIGNVITDTVIHRPAFWEAGQGYGVTCYNGARANSYRKVQANGCRHSVLFFKGASDNTVEDVTSIDCRISDVDFHGANETRNTVTGVKVIGGSSVSSDSTTKVGAKFGNPTHQAGCRGNVVRNLDMTNGQDYAVQFLPSEGNTVENITGTAQRESASNTIPERQR
jgi:hypothetical protein